MLCSPIPLPSGGQVTKGRKKKSRALTKKSAKKSKTKKARAGAAVAKMAAATRLDSLLDRELEETFPASDPLELTDPGSTGKPARKPR
jgi:hypothetical protein